MKLKITLYALLFALTSSLLSACKDAWNEHTQVVNTANAKDLGETIAGEPTVSKFNEYLKSTGLDVLLASPNTYTVWAPSNDAIAALNTSSPGYLADPASLKDFVKYHIINLTYPVSKNGDTLRVQTLNGKFRTVVGTRVDDATMVKSDIFAKNGVLHVINLASAVKPTIWAITHTDLGAPAVLAAMNSLDTTATVAGVSIIKRNPTWAAVAANMNLESGQFTYFVVKDAAYTQELQKITPYYFQNVVNKPDSTVETLTKTAMLRDLLVPGLYTPDNLPDTLLSYGGVKVPVSKSAIVASYRASNGIVYVMSALPYRLKDRVKPFKIEGESWRAIRDNGKRGNVYNRSKRDSLTGANYTDVEAHNHATSEFWFDYRVTNVNSVKYKVYTRAFAGMPGDPQAGDFTQRYGVPNPTNTNNTNVSFTQVVSASINNKARFNEVYLGDFTVTKFGTLNFRLVSAASTTINVNTLILDYLRFDPILP